MTAGTRIKICGITREEDALAAVRAGVDFLGFIFARQSPRCIEAARAAEIIARLDRAVETVGVFVDEDPRAVEEIVRLCGLDLAQLHGSESPLYCGRLACRVIKSFRVGPGAGRAELALYAGAVDFFLLDTYRKGLAGGTGETFDWNLIEKLDPPGPFILAGGIGPDNVAAAIEMVRPFAVDANSGVELSPGCKDEEKIKRLVKEVRRADSRGRE